DTPSNKKRILYLPVVVTTANLFLASFDPSKVSATNGTIDLSAVEYEEKKWITYDFPVPDYLKYQSIYHNRKNDDVERSTTFVVNSKHWAEFLKKLDFFHTSFKDPV